MKKLSVFLTIFTALLLILSSGPSAHAASKAAVEACKKNPQNTTTKSESAKKSAKAACETGYDAGVKGSDQADSCKKYNSDRNDKKSCYWGYGTGEAVKKKTDEAKTKGKQGAESGKSETDACKGLSGSAKSACTSAYKSAKKAKEKADAAAAQAPVQQCAGVSTYFKFDCAGRDTESGGSNNPIVGLILTIIGWMTGLVSVAIVGAIVYGGILYMTSQDSSGQTQKAITIIVDAVIGLFLLVGLFVIVNFIVPGGLFN